MTTFTTYIASWMRTYVRREEGATMVEYALIVAVIALVALAGAILLGVEVDKLFEDASQKTKAP